jgi:hypothetical protein
MMYYSKGDKVFNIQVQRITGECGTRPVTLSEISLLLAKIMSAWYEGKNKNTEGNGASDKSFDGQEKNSCVYDCLWASSGRVVILLKSLIQKAVCSNIQ